MLIINSISHKINKLFGEFDLAFNCSLESYCVWMMTTAKQLIMQQITNSTEMYFAKWYSKYYSIIAPITISSEQLIREWNYQVQTKSSVQMSTTFYAGWEWEWAHCYSDSNFNRNFIVISIFPKYISPMTTIALLPSNVSILTFTPAGGQCSPLHTLLISPPRVRERKSYCFHCSQQIECACLLLYMLGMAEEVLIENLLANWWPAYVFEYFHEWRTVSPNFRYFRTYNVIKMMRAYDFRVTHFLCQRHRLHHCVCICLFCFFHVQWHFHFESIFFSSHAFLKIGNSFCC